MKWQPIETAPKDGTRILLWCVNAYLHSHVKTGFLGCKGTVYSIFDDGDCGGHMTEEFVSHWMQLPEPPQDFSGDIGHE